MIRKLQKKFISITAAALFAMILIVMVTINCLFILQSNRMLDSRLELIMGEQDNGFQKTDGREREPAAPSDAPKQPPGQSPEQSPPSVSFDIMPRFEDRLRIRSDGCLIHLNEDGSIRDIIQGDAENYSEEELNDIVSDILAEEGEHGWCQYFKYAMKRHPLADGSSETVIGLINASSSLYSIFTMLLISGVIGILSFLLVLLIIILASKRAVKPIAESYLKQKQFVTDAGHELKTPLTVISANNELLRMIYGDSEWFDSIDKQVAKMNSLVCSLITLAKMDEEQKPVFAPFNLSDAVFDTAKSFENLIHSRGKLITFDIAEDISYLGDESKLRQVVSILMDNAVKYCDEGGKIAVSLKSGKQLRLRVINDCASADECELDKVFERFYRADRARISDGSYGLGLSIAKSIVELHKGEIHARALEHNRVMFEVVLK